MSQTAPVAPGTPPQESLVRTRLRNSRRHASGEERPRTRRGTLLVLWVLMLVYAILFSALSIRQHDAFVTHKDDLGRFDQSIWNTLHGQPFQRTEEGQQVSRFADHVEPILVPVSLVFLLWDDVRALLVLQAIAVALAVLPAFWLGRDELHAAGYPVSLAEAAGLAVACVCLLFPALEAANLTEFHAAPLMVAPMLLVLYYARWTHYGRMWFWALVVMSVKEEMALLTFMVALWLLIFRREWRHGLGLAVVSLVWWGVATLVIIPHYVDQVYGTEGAFYFARYGELGDSPLDVARSLVAQPALVWQIATEPDRVRYLLGLLASAGLVLALLAPEVLLLSLPILLANLLSSYEAMYSGVFHYSAAVVPFFVAAAAVGLGRVGRLLGSARFRGIHLTRQQAHGFVWVAVILLLLASLAYHRQQGATPLARGFSVPEVTEHHRLLERRFAPQIPEDAVLSTTAPLFPHLDHRERIHRFPIVEDAAWVLLDAGSYSGMHPADFRRAYDELVASGNWCILDAADGYVLLRRGDEGQSLPDEACQRTLPDGFYDFARKRDPQPEYGVQVDFGGQVRLLGYDAIPVSQWHRVGLRLYWTKLPQGDGDLQLHPFWLGAGGAMVETVEQRPLVEPYWYPTSRWQVGEIVVTEMLPWDIGDEFRLGVAVVDQGGERLPALVSGEEAHPVYTPEGGTWARMAAFRWNGRQPSSRVRLVDEGAPLAEPADALFGGRIALVGWELEPEGVGPGGQIGLRLNWRLGPDGAGAEPLEQDYTVFVHLLDAVGERVAQHDGEPNYLGALATSLWKPGVPLLDEHELSLPETLGPGNYSLVIGWYDRATGDRLPLADGADSLILGEVEVNE